jgi:hypothetical protein
VLAFNVSLWHEHATTFIEQEEYKVTAIKDGPDFSLAITLGEGRVCAPCIEKVLQAFREHLTSSPS